MDEVAIRIHIEPLEEGGFVATSSDVPGLVAEGRSIVEAVEIAQGLARKIAESCLEHGDPLPPALLPLAHGSTLDLVIPVGKSGARSMYQEKRPTCVTVIGWTWTIFGVLVCASAIMCLFACCFLITQVPEMHTGNQQNTPVVFWLFILLCVVQIVVALLGIVSGVNFLKLRSWSRRVLEILTWILLIFTVGFGIFWIPTWVVVTSRDAPLSFSIFGAVMGIVSTIVYGLPLGFMLKYLRGDTVKNAMKVLE